MEALALFRPHMALHWVWCGFSDSWKSLLLSFFLCFFVFFFPIYTDRLLWCHYSQRYCDAMLASIVLQQQEYLISMECVCYKQRLWGCACVNLSWCLRTVLPPRAILMWVASMSNCGHDDLLGLCWHRRVWWCPWPMHLQRTGLLSVVCIVTRDRT